MNTTPRPQSGLDQSCGPPLPIRTKLDCSNLLNTTCRILPFFATKGITFILDSLIRLTTNKLEDAIINNKDLHNYVKPKINVARPAYKRGPDAKRD
jgi:hypothetical protein